MSKTLISINTFNNGSTGQIMRNLSKSLRNQGYCTYSAYARGALSDILEGDILIGTQKDVYLHALYARITNRNAFGSKRSTMDLIRKITRINPDVIHLHNLHGYYLNYELLFTFLKNSQIPTVWTLHDCWAFTGHCTYFSNISCDRWMSRCEHCPLTHKSGSRGLIDSSRWNYTKRRNLVQDLPKEQLHLVTPSKWLAGLVGDSFLNGFSTTVINNGIDLDTFSPKLSTKRRDYDLCDKKVILGVASTWDERKGLGDYINLSRALDDSWRTVLIGLKSNQINDLPKNCIGLSRTNSLNELSQWYSTADIYLNLSRMETMGLTTVEALACGTPVIVYNLTALPEFVDNKATGLCVEPGVDNIIQAINVLESIKPTADSCRRQASRYSVDAMSKQYLSLFNQI